MLGVNSLKQLPEDTGIEVAFAGRSNVGKSSVINAITGHSRLARTSKTPGRTREINYFSIDSDKRLVDLPGYGYAKVPATVRQHWSRLLDSYFRKRVSLVALILIMDIRHPLKTFDTQMLDWCRHTDLPVHILLNKSDKLSKNAVKHSIQKLRQSLIRQPEVSLQAFSALRKQGIEEARHKLDDFFDW